MEDEGSGRAFLVLHGGMGNASSWQRVTDQLRDRFRTVRLHRRQYRLDVPRKVTMADEVAEVNAAAASLGTKPIIVGHSSGAVVALEALVAAPSLYSGAALYEPPLVLGAPLGAGGHLDRARAELDRGKPGNAFAIFMREIAGVRSPILALARFTMNRNRAIGPLVERQLDDNDAINELGNRLDAYRAIDVPVLLIGGERSPKHLGARLDALEAVLPRSTRVTLAGTGHTAERTAPAKLAEALSEYGSRPDA